MALSASDEEMNAIICAHNRAIVSEGIARCDPANDPVDEPVTSTADPTPTHKQLVEEADAAMAQLAAAEELYEERRLKTKDVKTSIDSLQHELVDCKRKRDDAHYDVKRKRLALEDAQDAEFNHPDNLAQRKAATVCAVLALYSPVNAEGVADPNWSATIVDHMPRTVDVERVHDELTRGIKEYGLVAAASYDVSMSSRINQLRLVLHNESREVVIFVAHQLEVEEDPDGKYPQWQSTLSLVVAGIHALEIDIVAGTRRNGRSVFFPTERTTIPDKFDEFVPGYHATSVNDPFFRFLSFLVAAFPRFEFSYKDAMPRASTSESVREIIAPRTLDNPSKV